MRRAKVIGCLLLVISILMVSVGISLEKNNNVLTSDLSFNEINTNNITASDSALAYNKFKFREDNSTLTAIDMETSPASIIVPPRIEVFDGLTIEELASKLDRHLGSDIMAGKGYFIATNCIEKGINPYIVTAIILHETGCGSKCSNLARSCFNVSGQKGKPSCNGGSFRKFDTLEDGIMGLINNLYNNYYSYGLDTVEKIAPKYAEGNTWAGKINYFVNKIREN